MVALAFYSTAYHAVANDHAHQSLHYRVQTAWEESVNVEDMRDAKLLDFVALFGDVECDYCHKRATGFNP
jgi:hypothetical protein